MYLSSITNTPLLKKYELMMCFTIFIFLLCLFFCYLDENVIAEGIIRPSETETNIRTRFSGIVTEVYYKNSQYVHDGYILFTQDCTYEEKKLQNLIDLQSLYKKKANSYEKLQELLESINIENLNYDEKLQEDDSVYSSFVNQYKSYKIDLESKKKYYERQLAIYPDCISKQALENSENSFIQCKFNFSSWIEKQKIEAFELYLQYSQKYEECNMQIIQMKKTIENATVKAIQSGFVCEITKISKGEYVAAETPILTIIPEKQGLKCVINISSSSISKIKIGQDVFFQIEDLPFTKYGKLQGKISMIPSDAVISEKPFFPVEVLLLQDYMVAKTRFGKTDTVLLKIGTKVNAKVIVDRNTIMQKILQKMVVYND